MNTRQQLIERLMFCMLHFRKGIVHSHEGKELTLPLAQSEALFVIGHAQSLGIGQLARHLSITPGAATQLVDPLVEMNYVQKLQDTQDRRTTNLELSDEGKTFLDSLRQHKTAKVTKIMQALNNQELQTLMMLLEKITKSLNDNGEGK